MKYMMTFYGAGGGYVIGRCVVHVPHPTNPIRDDFQDASLIWAAVDVGLNIYYSYEEVLTTFLREKGYTEDDWYDEYDSGIGAELDNMFTAYLYDWELMYIESMGGFIQCTDVVIEPVPPTYEVGVIAQNENPHFCRYQGMRR